MWGEKGIKYFKFIKNLENNCTKTKTKKLKYKVNIIKKVGCTLKPNHGGSIHKESRVDFKLDPL